MLDLYLFLFYVVFFFFYKIVLIKIRIVIIIIVLFGVRLSWYEVNILLIIVILLNKMEKKIVCLNFLVIWIFVVIGNVINDDIRRIFIICIDIVMIRVINIMKIKWIYFVFKLVDIVYFLLNDNRNSFLYNKIIVVIIIIVIILIIIKFVFVIVLILLNK